MKAVYIVCVKPRGAKSSSPICGYESRKAAEASVAVYRMMEDAKDWVYSIRKLRMGWVDRGAQVSA